MTIVIMLFTIYLIYRYREKLKKWKYHDRAMRYLIAGIMFFNMAIYYGEKLLSGTWDYHVHLPLHFCFISGYLFMFILVTNNKKLFKYGYFFSYAGPLLAIIFPDLTCGMDRFIFWQFVISHHFFMISSMYVIYVLEWKIEARDILKAIFLANIIFVSVFCINLVLSTNYIMTSRLPSHIIKLFPFLQNINKPILWLELGGLFAISVAYIPIYFFNKTTKQEKLEGQVLLA